MDLYVRGDRWIKHIRALIPGLKALPEIGGSDVFMDGLQQMNPAPLAWRQAQHREIRQRKARTAHHDPVRKVKQPLRLMPTRKIEKTVRADQIEESCVGH